MMRTITPIFSIIVGLLIFFFYSKPMFAEITLIQSEVLQFEEAAERASELNDALSEKLAAKRGYPAEALERLDALVPTSIDEIKILNDLNEIARTHNMLFGNISVTDEVKVQSPEVAVATNMVSYDDLTSASIDFSLIGTYDQFKAFLADIEKSLVMLEITNIKFSAGDGLLQQYAVTVQVSALPPTE